MNVLGTHGTRGGLWTTAIFVILFGTGCATQPDKLQTQYVSPVQYQKYDCNQITAEMERTSRRTNELYLSLKETADTDSAQVGLSLLLWPALFFLEYGDSPQAAEYSRLKGEYEALESVAIQKNCSIPTTAKISKWALLAQQTAKDSCTTPGIPKLLSAMGDQEDFQVPCGSGAPLIVRCETGECRKLQ